MLDIRPGYRERKRKGEMIITLLLGKQLFPVHPLVCSCLSVCLDEVELCIDVFVR